MEGIQNSVRCVCHKHHVLKAKTAAKLDSFKNSGDFLSNIHIVAFPGQMVPAHTPALLGSFAGNNF